MLTVAGSVVYKSIPRKTNNTNKDTTHPVTPGQLSVRVCHKPRFAASIAACRCMTVASNFMSIVVVGLLLLLLGCSTKCADTLQKKGGWGRERRREGRKDGRKEGRKEEAKRGRAA